jgi:hypothetical protein
MKFPVRFLALFAAVFRGLATAAHLERLLFWFPFTATCANRGGKCRNIVAGRHPTARV